MGGAYSGIPVAPWSHRRRTQGVRFGGLSRGDTPSCITVVAHLRVDRDGGQSVNSAGAADGLPVSAHSQPKPLSVKRAILGVLKRRPVAGRIVVLDPGSGRTEEPVSGCEPVALAIGVAWGDNG